MNKKSGFVLSTYVYILLVFFLLLLGTMLLVLNNTRLLSNKIKEGTQGTSGLIDKDYSFILLGDKETVIRKGEEYEESGFIAKTIKGVELDDKVIVENNIDTNVIGDYEIRYKVTYNGITKNLTRTVHVLDNVGVNYINGLYEYKADENGLIKDDTDDENIRYSGSNSIVKNYVEFGNTGELWRIIGVFDVASDINGTPISRLKLVRNESIGEYSWDSSEGTINEGYGENDWLNADLNELLNNYYYNGLSNQTCYDGLSNKTTACDFSSTTTGVKGLNSNAINLITDTVWNTGGVTYSNPETAPYGLPTLSTYNDERGEVAYDGRETKWTGKIGLIYPSDYGYASTDMECKNNLRAGVSLNGDDSNNYTNAACKNNNWLYTNTTYWTLTPKSIDARNVFYIYRLGAPSTSYETVGAAYAYNVRPSVYLNPFVKIVDGSGTQADPYKLSL